MKMILGALLAMSGDPTVWWGGGVSETAGAGQGGLIESTTQVEGDVRFEKDDLYLRADVDVTLDTLGGVTPTMYPPEWAMVQYAPGSLRLRLGVTSPNFNVEDWDAWNNYLPTFSVMFNGASPGRLLGGQVGWALDDATEVFAYGGLDLDYCTLADPECAFADAPPIAGLGIDVERDMFATWSGIALYPTEGYYGAWVGFEVYPLDQLWLTLDGGAGLSGGAPFAGGQLVVNLFPEAVVAPVLRAEAVFDPDDAALGFAESRIANRTLSVGARLQSLSWLRIMAEAKLNVYHGDMEPGIYLMAAAFRPEPPSYTAREEDSE